MPAPVMTRKGLLGRSLLGKNVPPGKKERVMFTERQKNVVLALVALFVLAFSTGALAVGGYLDTFNTKYGTAGTRLSSCSVCHTTTPSTNAYGKAFTNNHTGSTTTSQAMSKIEPVDSDGDTFTNLAEINARTFPGNSADKPSPQSTLALTGISIQGANSVNEHTRSTYAATASYSDGSSKNVHAAWSANSPYATINTSGVLSAQAVTANQPVTITAAYTEGAATKTATKGVTLVEGTPAPGQPLFRDDFSEVTASGSSNWEIAAGNWSGKGGRFSSTINANNIALIMNVPAWIHLKPGASNPWSS